MPAAAEFLDALDAAALRRWCAVGLEGLTAARQEIDDLNVYPVPDGDTGTNLQLTMASVVDALASAGPDMAATLEAVVRGSLMGARGNSGVILSQLLRGLSEGLTSADRCGPPQLRAALTRSSQSAYAAVGTPAEGTLLTVAREAAEAAALTTGDLADLVRTARQAAAASLARTPDLLPQLKAAGVVDAGGRGWCVLLEALEAVVTGRVAAAAPPLLVPRDRSAVLVAREAGSDLFGYEVQFLLADAGPDAVALLKGRLLGLGDSLLVVGTEQLHAVHVHVNDVGAAIEAGLEAGRPFRITVTRFADQVVGPPPDGCRHPPGRAVVAVAAGDGLAALFRGCGALVVAGGPTANPSLAELLDAVQASGAEQVVLLPNDSNVAAVAAAAALQARALGLQVAVVPTWSVVQGLAAVSITDPRRPFDVDVAAMAGAAGATRWAEVTTAVRAATTEAGPCRAGDVLGLIEGRVTAVGHDVEQVARHVVHRMLAGGGGQVTVLTGADLADGAGDRLASYVSTMHPGVETCVLVGGQPHYPVLLGVE